MNKILSLLLFLGVAGSLPAQTEYLSNLSQTNDQYGRVSSDDWDIQSFVTGTNATGYDLNSIFLGMGDLLEGTPPGDMSVFLYSSSGTDPGSSLGQLSGSTDPISSGTYEYTANALHLDPATTYWIVATGTTPAYQGSFNWSLTTSDSYSLVGGWSIDVDTGGAGSSGDGGSSWGFFGGPTWIHRFSITATPSAVPEPATYALFAGLLVFAGMVILRGRRFVRAACRGGSAGGIAPSSRR